jgi:hypothetical protein
MRFIVWLLIHSVYRLKKEGLEHIPEEGAAVIVCNHVSFVDALIIAAACPRPIRFVMDHRIFKLPIINFVFREGRAIPIAPGRKPATAVGAHDEIARAPAGRLVSIFPRLHHERRRAVAIPQQNRQDRRPPVPVVLMACAPVGQLLRVWVGRATKPFRRGPFSHRVAVAPHRRRRHCNAAARVAELRRDWNRERQRLPACSSA